MTFFNSLVLAISGLMGWLAFPSGNSNGHHLENTLIHSTKPSTDVMKMAIQGYEKLKSQGNLAKSQTLTIVDFSLSSGKKRLWVINPLTKEVLHHSLVAHGKNTGNVYAKDFSNKAGSLQSSLGFYTTAETYYGKHGYSLRLDGLEAGVNDKARDRAIVMHGAQYVSKEFIEKYGRLGRSFGCPAVPSGKNKSIINAIKGGSCLFIYHPDYQSH